MERDEDSPALDPSYVAGLLDAVGRVRFDINETPEGQYTVRPMVRLRPYQTQLRAAAIGEFLEGGDYQYDFIERGYGDEFFRLQRWRDFEALQSFLGGRSAQLVRELAFVTDVFAEEFDGILDPSAVYRFALSRDQLRYGWRPRGRYHVSPEDIAEGHAFDTESVETPPLPDADLRTGYTVEWIAGVYDGACRYRPSIAESSDYEIGYAQHPIARLHRAGVSSTFVSSVLQFCDDYDLTYGDASEQNTLRITFTGASNVRRVLDVLFPRLLVLADASEALVETILPRFDENVHHGKQGFYDLLRDFEEVAAVSGGPFRQRDYDPSYFADLWRDDLDLVAEGGRTTPSDDPLSAAREHVGEATVSPDEFETTPRRFRTVVDRINRDAGLVTDLKSLYDDRCQLCSARLASSDGTGYSEVHHLQPLGAPHDGVDAVGNMLVLCPNHHADFDNGVVRVDTGDLSVEHPYDSAVDGDTITTASDHELSASALRYHNEHICRLR
jgi:hypothetical protein